MAFDNPITDDFGLEVIRKAAIRNPDGSPTQYSLATGGTTTGTFSITGLGLGKIREVALTDSAWVDLTAYLVSEGVVGLNYVAVQNISGNGNVLLWNYEDTGPVGPGWRIEDGGFRSVLVRNLPTSTVFIKMLSGAGTINAEGLAPGP